MPFGRAFVLVQLTALGLAAAGASGPTAVRIEFEGPAGCSDAERFYARVRARTERVRKAGPSEAGLRLRVRLQPPASGKVHGELRIVDERGEATARSVDGASCEEVVEALSLTAALALDPTAKLTTSPAPASGAAAANGDGSGGAAATSGSTAAAAAPSKESAGAAAAKGSVESDSAKRASTAAANAPVETTPPASTPAGDGESGSAHGPTTFGGELGAQLLLTRVVSPHLNYGAQAFGRLTLRDGERTTASLGLALAYSGNDLLETSDSLSLRMTSVSLQLCPRRWGEALTLELCALGSGGLLVASGRGISDPATARRSYFTLGGLARAALALGARVQLELEAGAFAPLVYRDYVLSSPGRLLGETPGFSAMGALGASYGF